jgi:hypothetical protein
MYAPLPTSLIRLIPTAFTVAWLHIPIKIVVAEKIKAVLSSFLISKANFLSFGVIGLLAMTTGRDGKFFLNYAYKRS